MSTVLDVLFLTPDARPLVLVLVTCLPVLALMWPRSSIIVEGASRLCLAWLVVEGVGAVGADVAAEKHHC